MRSHRSNEKTQERYGGLTTDRGVFNGKIRLMEESLEIPLHVRKPTVWAIWNDLFHKDVPSEFIQKAWAVMSRCCLRTLSQSHVFVVLTKRPERVAVECKKEIRRQGYVKERVWPLLFPNVVIGTTVENQAAADERIQHLRKCPAARRALSIEPLLGPLPRLDLEGIHWAIVGAETGRNARPMKLDWARSIRDQCKAAGVPFWFKSAGLGVAIPPDLDIRDVPARG
jgi:protein gp37